SNVSLDASGNLVLQAKNTGPSSPSLTLFDQTGNKGSLPWFTHAMAVTTAGKNGDTVSSAIQVFDSQGTPHNLSLTFTKTGNNVWSVSASIPPAEGTMTTSTITGITFNADGSFQQVVGNPTPQFVMQINGLAVPQVIKLAMATPNKFDGLTQ